MLKRSIILLCLLISSSVFSQLKTFDFLDHKLRKGDMKTLYDLAEYFDSEEKYVETLGYHIIHTTESNVAKRIVRENSMFLPTEIVIDTATSSQDFKKFLSDNRASLTFSKLADAFILTPFSERKTRYEIVALTPDKIQNLNTRRNELLNFAWVKDNEIDQLIKEKNPRALLEIASVLVKRRYHHDEYSYDQKDMTDLLSVLTNSYIAVPQEHNIMSYHIENDFYETSKVNLLTFFANHYKDYKWNATLNIFENPSLSIKKVDKETGLFEKLVSKNDTIALNAFIELSTSDIEKVTKLANEYDRSRIRANYNIPTFPYRFLKQLVLFTDYCKKEQIDFTGSETLQHKIATLQTNLSFKERRQLENELINFLTLDTVEAFEYWAAVYSNKWGFTYSAGRILDTFYSKNWNELVRTKKYLKNYVLKARWFKRLGIIGFCNLYLVKFTGATPEVLKALEEVSIDTEISSDIVTKAIKIAKTPIVYIEREKKSSHANSTERLKDFQSEFKKIMASQLDSTELKKKLNYAVSRITYEQIGEALKAIEAFPFKNYYLKYSFLERDFGFSHIPSITDNKNRADFLKNYQKYSEEEMYRYSLTQAGIEFTNADKTLNYDTIYEILKYDINIAFAGGGGGAQDNGVYAIIKILELTHKTTLGYPDKFCTSNSMYGCTSSDRAAAWRNYLKVNKLLQKEHNEPVSFAYEGKEK
ncbi:hypothetical protein [Kordia sp.]|uniref:hypothetical protein n=1 Tax=Kordia sp. TaxID=1965332 RepID=UPI003D6B33D6